MSKKLAKLLAKPEAEIAKAVAKFEASCGYPSEDVRLLAEVKQTLRGKMNQLGLDPEDTTDDELYHALRARFERDDQMINQAMGVNDTTKFSEKLAKATQLVNHCAQTDDAWVVKNQVAKSILTKSPPKKVAKLLGYRSVASLIKREDVVEIYLISQFIESSSWQKTIEREFSKLAQTNYELRPVKIINLPDKIPSSIDGPESYLAIDKNLGVVALWPSAKIEHYSVLQLTLQLLSGLQDVNPDGYHESLHELSPALQWWSDTNYLVSDGDNPISFNLKDVALNQADNKESNEAALHHAGQSLWQELEGRYKQIAASLAEQVADATENVETPKLPLTSEIANEFATVE